MAESTSTELTISSDDFGSNTPIQQEQKSGFLGSMGGGTDLVRQISLIVALLQHESDPVFRGRLLSIYTVTSQVIPAAGGLGAGLLLEVLPANQGLLVVGSILSLLFVLAIWRLRLLRGYA